MAQAQADYAGVFNANRNANAATTARARKMAVNSLVNEELNRDRGLGEIALDTGAALTQGGLGLVESAYGIANIAS